MVSKPKPGVRGWFERDQLWHDSQVQCKYNVLHGQQIQPQRDDYVKKKGESELNNSPASQSAESQQREYRGSPINKTPRWEC